MKLTVWRSCPRATLGRPLRARSPARSRAARRSSCSRRRSRTLCPRRAWRRTRSNPSGGGGGRRRPRARAATVPKCRGACIARRGDGRARRRRRATRRAACGRADATVASFKLETNAHIGSSPRRRGRSRGLRRRPGNRRERARALQAPLCGYRSRARGCGGATPFAALTRRSRTPAAATSPATRPPSSSRCAASSAVAHRDPATAADAFPPSRAGRRRDRASRHSRRARRARAGGDDGARSGLQDGRKFDSSSSSSASAAAAAAHCERPRRRLMSRQLRDARPLACRQGRSSSSQDADAYRGVPPIPRRDRPFLHTADVLAPSLARASLSLSLSRRSLSLS